MNRSVIKKINVFSLIQTLAQLHNEGVAYIDLYAEQKEADRHIIGILFNKGYMVEGMEYRFDEILKNAPEEEKESKDDNIKLSDDIINKLL